MRRVAVLTSGGGAPGTNAAVRAVVRSAAASGVVTIGARDGYGGLIDGALEPLDPVAVAGIAGASGSILGGGGSRDFRTSEGRRQALAHLDLAEVEGLVVIGGDGSLRGADALSREGHVRVVAIPAAIERDLGGSDFTIGFDTAVNTALAAIDRLHAGTPDGPRLDLVEVAGRRSGWGALHCAIGSGATAVVVPERPVDVGAIRARVRATVAGDASSCHVVVAEGGVEDSHEGARDVADAVLDGLDGIAHRVVVLGHDQRHGAPSMRDRVLGARLGHAAVEALRAGADRIMVGEQSGAVTRTALTRAGSSAAPPPTELFELADRLAG